MRVSATAFALVAQSVACFSSVLEKWGFPIWSKGRKRGGKCCCVKSRLCGCSVYRSCSTLSKIMHWMDARALRRKDAFRGERPWGERASVIHGSPIGRNQTTTTLSFPSPSSATTASFPPPLSPPNWAPIRLLHPESRTSSTRKSPPDWTRGWSDQLGFRSRQWRRSGSPSTRTRAPTSGRVSGPGSLGMSRPRYSSPPRYRTRAVSRQLRLLGVGLRW